MPSHTVVDYVVLDDGSSRLWASIEGYPAWVTKVLILNVDGVPTVADLRVHPRQDTFAHVQADGSVKTSVIRSDGVSSDSDGIEPGMDWTELPSDTPPGGIPSRLLRRINVGELMDLARDAAKQESHYRKQLAQKARRRNSDQADYLDRIAEATKEFARDRKRPGSGGHGIDHYLIWAVRYANRVRAGSRRPHAELAAEYHDQLDMDEAHARVWIRDTVTDARRRYHLLTPKTGQGRAGGDLSDKAKRLIAEKEGH